MAGSGPTDKGLDIAHSTLTGHDWAFIFAVILIPVGWLKTMKEISVSRGNNVLYSFPSSNVLSL
jgi:hypothetical protein